MEVCLLFLPSSLLPLPPLLLSPPLSSSPLLPFLHPSLLLSPFSSSSFTPCTGCSKMAATCKPASHLDLDFQPPEAWRKCLFYSQGPWWFCYNRKIWLSQKAASQGGELQGSCHQRHTWMKQAQHQEDTVTGRVMLTPCWDFGKGLSVKTSATDACTVHGRRPTCIESYRVWGNLCALNSGSLGSL